MVRKVNVLSTSAVTATGLALALGSGITSADVELPGTVIWSAYPTGTTGYSQAVGIGQVLQNEYGVNLRVIPGRNDVSRLEPLRRDRAHFSAGGTEAVSAQEAQFNFAEPAWGPQQTRVLMWAISDACSFTIAAAGDSGIDEVADMEGKRVAWVQGAPTLNAGMEYLLSYADLTWDDVEKREVGGYMSAVEAIIEDRADAMGGSCDSAPFQRINASPRGLNFPQLPHDNEEGLARISQYAPWLVPFKSVGNVGMDPDEEIEVVTGPYPMLISMADQDEDVAYNMTKAMHQHYEDYKNSAPGAEGWEVERMDLTSMPIPFHDGAIRYFEEIGLWDEEAQAYHEESLKRQEVLAEAWERHLEDAPTDRDAFQEAWMQTRYDALEEADLPTLRSFW